MGANLSGKDIANGDFMIKTSVADPEAGYAKEKFHADPKNGVIISEVDGPKGKRLEFSADWSVVSLDTKLQKGDNIEISEDPVTGKVEISAPDVGKVKINDQDKTLDYLDEKISVSFPLIKEYGGTQHNKIFISCFEKIPFGQFDAKWSDESYDKDNYDTRAVIVGRISNDTAGLSGVNFCATQANPATFKIEYANLSGSAQSLNLYVTTDISDWSDAELFTVDLETTVADQVKTAEVEIEGMGDYPLFFLLVSDEYGEVVRDIVIYNIYKY